MQNARQWIGVQWRDWRYVLQATAFAMAKRHAMDGYSGPAATLTQFASIAESGSTSSLELFVLSLLMRGVPTIKIGVHAFKLAWSTRPSISK